MSGSTEKNSQSVTSDDKLAANQLDGVLTEETLLSKHSVLPEDALTRADTEDFAIKKHETLKQDDVVSGQATRYIGRERREKLDQLIEVLYNRVANELNDNPKDVMFALEKLKKAQGVALEDVGQYEEALYWVAQVKKMLVKKHNRRRWSYSWGIFVFFYALVWLVACIAGFFVDIKTLGIGETGGWFSALAGGIGGVVIILYNLSWQVSVTQEFERQHLMKYLVQPIMGFGLGGVIFVITSAGFLATHTTDFGEGDTLLGGQRLIAYQILLGFMAGFGQQFIYALIDRIVKSLSPKAAKATDVSTTSVAKETTNVVPQNDHDMFETTQKPVS